MGAVVDVAGVFAGRSTAVIPVGASASDVTRASVATITVASTVCAVVGVEIGTDVGWPPVQARAARVIIARNTSATGLIYQLSTVIFEILFPDRPSGCGNVHALHQQPQVIARKGSIRRVAAFRSEHSEPI